ncbi:ATP-binding protein [Streptomyces sp. NPDC059740]|uniref:ATP-binding protein n=1 Tax=Streptomyces sp. NPDC059740 TaxID=3346926 RepID=UPI00365FC8EC
MTPHRPHPPQAAPAVVLEAGVTSLAGMRRIVGEYLDQACPGADRGAVLLVVTELVTNAARHATGWWRLSLRADYGVLTAEVEDHSTEPPRPRAPDNTTGTGGLGWHIAERLTSELRYLVHEHGKTVWASWADPGAPPGSTPSSGRY